MDYNTIRCTKRTNSVIISMFVFIALCQSRCIYKTMSLLVYTLVNSVFGVISRKKLTCWTNYPNLCCWICLCLKAAIFSCYCLACSLLNQPFM